MSYAKRKGSTCVVIHRCGGCGKKMRFVCAGKFRVNANGRRLDVWLIYRCEKCGHTLNIPLCERAAPGKIPGGLYKKFLENDRELAESYAQNRGFFKGKGYKVE